MLPPRRAAAVADRVGARPRAVGDEGRDERLDRVDLADDEPRAVDEVVARVDGDPATGQIPPEPPQQGDLRVGRVVEHEGGAQAADRAQLPVTDELRDGADGGRPAVAGGQAVEDTGRLARLEHLGGDVGRCPERLLAHDVLARGRDGQDDLAVEDGRQADDDEVDVLGGHQRTPVGLDPLVAEPFGEPGRQRRVDVGDGHEPRPDGQVRVELGDVRERDAVGRGHRAGTDHPDAKFARSGPHHPSRDGWWRPEPITNDNVCTGSWRTPTSARRRGPALSRSGAG